MSDRVKRASNSLRKANHKIASKQKVDKRPHIEHLENKWSKKQ